MNLKSQRRQYDLVGEAKRLGCREIELIDDDLGRSAGLQLLIPPPLQLRRHQAVVLVHGIVLPLRKARLITGSLQLQVALPLLNCQIVLQLINHAQTDG